MLRELFSTFIRHSEIERGLSPRTLLGYENTFRILVAFTNKPDIPTNTFTTDLVRNLLYYGKEERNWTTKTYHIHYDNFNVFAKWLVLEGHLKANPLLRIQKPKHKKVILQPLKDEQIHKILYVALLKSSLNPFLRLRNHAMLMLALHSGLRMGEFLTLKLPHVQLEEKQLHVHHGKGGKDRIVMITDELVSILALYMKEHEKFFLMHTLILFPSQSGKFFDVRDFRRMTERIVRISGIRFTSHDLRRSYATNLSKQN
ncbi:MAG: tyrosine-type recombinase/integrase, partial [Psychrosphaera sp.]|nr:tyrosine-type recombinase/integrase [Psychrosphaera sp.]